MPQLLPNLPSFDPVHRLLDALLRVKNEEGKLSPPIVVGALALMERFPFDPNARIHPASPTLASRSVLEVAVKLSEHDDKWLPTHRAWPMDLPSLLMASENTLDQMDAERLAATLLAAGADPWSDVSDEHPLGTVLPLAMNRRLAGLCTRIWACEKGRPGLDVLSSVPPLAAVRVPALRSWLDWATFTYNSHGMARWLLSLGVRSPPGGHSLKWAQDPQMIQIYHEVGDVPSTPQAQAKIEREWEKRMGRHDLKHESLTQLKHALKGFARPAVEAPACDSDVHDSILHALTLSAWNSDRSRDLPKKLPFEVLNQRATINHGIEKGQWSHLAALLMEPVRFCEYASAGHIGILDIEDLIALPDPTKRLLHDSKTDSAYTGALSAAINFDWRPGISINGPVGLVLHGEYDTNAGCNDLVHLCSLLGIEDFQAWWQDNLLSAARFTHAVSSRSLMAATRLSHIWAQVLQQAPESLAGHEEAVLLLMQCAQRHFQVDERQGVTRRRIGGRTLRYRKEHHMHALVRHAPTPLTVDWQVELALLANLDTPSFLADLVPLAVQGHLQARHVARIEKFIRATEKRIAPALEGKGIVGRGTSHEHLKERGELFRAELLPRLRQVLLAATMPAACPSTPVASRL